MLTHELDYDLPAELIAQCPIEPRDASRLMVVDRATGDIKHRRFSDIQDLLAPADLLVANDSRVIPARIQARKPTGGRAELLLLRKLSATRWQALVGGRHVRQACIPLADGHEIVAVVDDQDESDAEKMVEFSEPIEPYLDRIGQMPIPPYIRAQPGDPGRYQTIFARLSGSAAAPTAGLHFTPQRVQALERRGIRFAFVTLHIGLDTFKPIGEAVVEDHSIHTEWCELPASTAQAVAAARERNGRVVAVGTTSVRVLETAAAAAAAGTTLAPHAGFTSLYITPGFRFRAVDALITNFHLPRSTLLAMISAFMGLDLMRLAYAEAIRERYRFYSFGDAMLIL